MALPQEQEHLYTMEDIENLPKGIRAELIDGRIYYMAPPSSRHQRIVMNISSIIHQYIKTKNGKCEVFPAPFGVYLNGDDKNSHIEPDISVICNPDLIKDKGCYGAPDWIIEVTSQHNPGRDYIEKLNLYYLAGVKEYWIIDPVKDKIAVYYFSNGEFIPRPYTFKDKVKVNTYKDLVIDFKELNI